MIIRNEQPSDIKAIAAITAAAFTNHPVGRNTEPFIIAALRAAGALSLSLIAEMEGRVVGHIAFSPVTISGRECGWYGLGPISVAPDMQRRGIGSALVREGLERLRKSGAQGCALVGDPGFYARFGFRNIPQLTLAGVPPEFFLALPLEAGAVWEDGDPRGEVAFHEGFKAEK